MEFNACALLLANLIYRTVQRMSQSMVGFGSILGILHSVPARGSQASEQGNDELIAPCRQAQQHTFSLADNEMYLINITDTFVKYFLINLLSLSNKHTLVQGTWGT